MSLVTMILVGGLMGIVFGVALEKSRVFEPGMIVGQMQLRNFIMIKVFLSAVATGLVVLAVLNGLELTKLHPKDTYFLGNLVGGLVFGAGMVLAGACPGTVMAQIGSGYRDALTVLAGGILGAMAYGYAEPAIKPLPLDGDGKLTFHGLLGVPFWALASIVAVALVLILVRLERWRPWRSEFGRDYDGASTPG